MDSLSHRSNASMEENLCNMASKGTLTSLFFLIHIKSSVCLHKKSESYKSIVVHWGLIKVSKVVWSWNILLEAVDVRFLLDYKQDIPCFFQLHFCPGKNRHLKRSLGELSFVQNCLRLQLFIIHCNYGCCLQQTGRKIRM